MKSLLAVICLLASTQVFAQQTGLIFSQDSQSLRQRQMDLEQALVEPQRPVGSITQKDLDSIALCKMRLQANAKQHQINIQQFDVRVSPDASNLFTVSGFGSTQLRSMTIIGSDCKDGQLVEYTGRQ